MANDELKKKICKIIAPYVSAWGEDERIADALIEDDNIFEILAGMIDYMHETGSNRLIDRRTGETYIFSKELAEEKNE